MSPSPFHRLARPKQIDPDMTTTLLPLFDVPSEFADKVLLETPDGSAFTYRRFFALTARLAHTLRGCGVEPGDRDAVQVDKSPEALALYVACVRVGAVYLPLNTAYTASEVDYFVGDAEPRLVVCRPSSRTE
jgi:malonyl-CoA/methylmalonyl-CoA synthetase